MFVDKTPNEVILFCDKMTGKCFVRLVDAQYDDILRFGKLPGLCRVSDLIVKVLPVTSIQREDDAWTVNDSIIFKLDADGRCVRVCSHDECGEYDADSCIRGLFGVKFVL